MTDPAKTAHVFASGERVDGRYRIDSLVGRGGMGEVYQATEIDGGRQVAVKVIRPHLFTNERTRARFAREVGIMRRVRHPNVVDLYDVFDLPPRAGSEKPMPCLVMEWLDGESLADHLERVGPLPPPVAGRFVGQIAGALGAAHRADVVHRDLKPENVLVLDAESESARVVLTDFGVAREDVDRGRDPNDSDRVTATDVLLGTPDYMAPEQLELEEAIPASDLYALGLCWYQMITGRLPHDDGANRLDSLFRRLREPPPSPRLLVPELPPDEERILLRCLARDPDARWPDADSLRKALAADDGDFVREIGREQWIAALTVLAILLAIGALVYWNGFG